jgi:hypothetical protein
MSVKVKRSSNVTVAFFKEIELLITLPLNTDKRMKNKSREQKSRVFD